MSNIPNIPRIHLSNIVMVDREINPSIELGDRDAASSDVAKEVQVVAKGSDYLFLLKSWLLGHKSSTLKGICFRALIDEEFLDMKENCCMVGSGC